MNLLDELQDMFPHSITVEPFVSSDGRGVKTYDGTPVPRKCRIAQSNTKIIRDDTGIEEVSTVNAVFAETFDVTSKDRFTLPSGYEPTQPEGMAVTKAPDENGLHHERVFF
jgi:hypothetical protein